MATESAAAAETVVADRAVAPTPPRWSRALALALVALAGCLCLALPFWGDQALFTVYGRQLAHGAVLYRDVFDVKQPGIFVFYAVAGSLFGFTEVGIHLFELLYWLVFSIFAILALPPYFRTRWVPPLVPVLTVVVYYCYAGLLDLTQVEVLVAFPIVLAWWLIDGAPADARARSRRYAVAGLAAASVVLLKHLYVLIVFAYVVYAVVRARRSGIPVREQRRSIVAFAAAFVVPLLAVVAYFAAYGQLGRIWWAYFELAPSAQLGGPRPLDYLIEGGRRFLIGEGPVLILAALGSVESLRRRTRPRLDLVIGMLLWLAVGGAAFLIQGWPIYKWSLFTMPVGILGVVGLDVLAGIARRPSARWSIAVAVAALLSVPVVIGASPHGQTLLLSTIVVGFAMGAGLALARRRSARWMVPVLVAALIVSIGLAAIAAVDKVRVLAGHDFALTVDARAELRRSVSDAYRAADDDLEVLRRRGGLPGSLYVFGDPVVLLRADRPQAVPILGWGPELLDATAWRELYSELRSTIPPAIVVDRYPRSLIRRRYPAILRFIESRYDVALVGQSGTWYELR